MGGKLNAGFLHITLGTYFRCQRLDVMHVPVITHW